MRSKLEKELAKRMERERNYYRDLCLECLDFVRTRHNPRYADQRSLMIKLKNASKEKLVTIELTK